MAESKSFKWLRSIHKATCYDKKTELTFCIINNSDSTSIDDKFTYRCTDNDRRLMFDRKISFAAAMVVVNSWNGEVEVQQKELAVQMS
jgi:hypothetical protein